MDHIQCNTNPAQTHHPSTNNFVSAEPKEQQQNEKSIVYAAFERLCSLVQPKIELQVSKRSPAINNGNTGPRKTSLHDSSHTTPEFPGNKKAKLSTAGENRAISKPEECDFSNSVDVPKTEKDLISLFKTPGDNSYNYYGKLAEKKRLDDNFKFPEGKPFLQSLKKMAHQFAEKKDTSKEEKIVFKRAMADCDQLISTSEGVGYLDTMEFTQRVLSIIDFYHYSRKIKPALKGLDQRGAPIDKMVLICSCSPIKSESNKDKIERFKIKINGNVFRVPTDDDVYSLFKSNIERELYFTYYPEQWNITDVYKKESIINAVDYQYFKSILKHKTVILLPTTLSIGYRSYCFILRFPIWFIDVSDKLSVVDGFPSMPLHTFYHDYFHVELAISLDKARYNQEYYNELGWAQEENKFINNKNAIELLYKEFSTRVDHLKKESKETFWTLLFEHTHEGLAHHNPMNPFQLLKFDEKTLKRVTNEMATKAKKKIKEDFYPKIEKAWTEHVPQAREVLIASVAKVKQDILTIAQE